jgi:spore germination protein YaaH
MRTAAVAAFVLISASSAFAYKQSAWIPPWNAEALKSIQLNAGALSESNPVWYSWNANGTILKNWNAENPTWRAAMTGTLLLPTIQNVVNDSFDGAAAATVLATPASREASASEIAALVNNQSFDGIDIDYERVPTSSRANFTDFLGTLGQRLRVSGKKLSVTVYAKASDSENWNGPGAEDWQAIGQIADSVKIMAYDYSYLGSAAGPIAPLGWLDSVATYAEKTIPSSKIIMALPWYGYDWSSVSPTRSLSYAAAIQFAQTNGATISHDVNGEATFSFGTHTVFFIDAASYSQKVALLKQKHPSIGGFGAWSLGVEDPAIWSIIRGSDSSGGTPPPTPPAGIAISGPDSMTATRGASASGSYQLVSINGFNGTATITVQPPAGFAGLITADSASVGAGGSFRLTAATTTATRPGSYQIDLKLNSGSLTAEQFVTLIVTEPARHHAARQ